MQRHSLYTLILFSLFGLTNCHNNETIGLLEGVWVYDYRINNLYLNDTSGFFKTPATTVLDLQPSGDLIVKNFGYRDTTFTWSLKSDTLINLGNLEYRLFEVNSDSLTIIDYNSADTFWIVYKKPIQTKLKKSISEIKETFVNSLWTVTNQNIRAWQTNVEYFNNNTMLYRYPMFNRTLKDSTDNLQIETYGIGQYKDYYFLYNFLDWETGNGSSTSINQILDVNPESYSINEYVNGENETVNYVSKHFDSEDLQRTRTNLIGRWSSNNSADKSYGEFIPERAIKNGQMELFNGILSYELNEDGTSLILLNDIEYASARWMISKDCRTLIFEHEINEEDRQGVYIEYVNILETEKQQLSARLFSTNYYTGKEKPSRYLLNIFQDFRKQDVK